MEENKLNKQHIGDGVYISYDGYHFVLEANVPTTDTIYLDNYVTDALIRYIANMRKDVFHGCLDKG